MFSFFCYFIALRLALPYFYFIYVKYDYITPHLCNLGKFKWQLKYRSCFPRCSWSLCRYLMTSQNVLGSTSRHYRCSSSCWSGSEARSTCSTSCRSWVRMPEILRWRDSILVTSGTLAWCTWLSWADYGKKYKVSLLPIKSNFFSSIISCSPISSSSLER